MNILLFLIPVSIVLMGLAIWAFVWAVRRGQFDDLDTPALDILREDAHDRRAPAARSPADEAAANPAAGPPDDAPPADPRHD
jgi:cbb3-type cytochrome oxidase maturation protein